MLAAALADEPRAASQAHFCEKGVYFSKLALLIFFFTAFSRYLQRFWTALSAPATEHGRYSAEQRQLLSPGKQATVSPRVTRKFTRHPRQERNLPVTTPPFEK